MASDPVYREAPPTEPRRRRWVVVAVATLSLLLFLAATLRAANSASARTDAQHETIEARGRKERAAKVAAAATQEQADAVKEAESVQVSIASPVATIEGLVLMSDQLVTASRDAQSVSASTDRAAVETCNEAITRGNLLIDQLDAAVERLADQLDTVAGTDRVVA